MIARPTAEGFQEVKVGPGKTEMVDVGTDQPQTSRKGDHELGTVPGIERIPCGLPNQVLVEAARRSAGGISVVADAVGIAG